ncbi:MAG TPA: DUF6703 family protein [Microlunatus sp.]
MSANEATRRSPVRSRIERASRPWLLRLSASPRPAIVIGTVLLIVLGLLAPPVVAWPALVIVFAFVAWIAYLSWPVVSTGGKLARLVMLALIVIMAGTRLQT